MSADIKTWQKRMQDEFGLDTRGWKPDSYMIAEIKDLRAALAAAERDAAFGKVIATGYEAGAATNEGLGGTVRLHYQSEAEAENAFNAISDAIDAAMSTQEQGEKSE